MRQLDNKRKSNARLLRMKSISRMPERALSWSDDSADLCIRRGTIGRNGPDVSKRAMTVDISPTSGEPLTSISSRLPDTVFEDDEDQHDTQERRPLMDQDCRNTTDQEQRHAHFERQNAVISDDIPLKPILKRAKSDG
ncbi:hypothetical protein KUTeg_012007 [Tegillarca granosa]|uniref:Uncharacterized protein n=1 Tax=Tegillarca granosa TaxID=220873 RepID=A0ABQ9F1J1_TEGGR|nr:hypothetical protein KUTeg_012007 [Tegillarca granosa]